MALTISLLISASSARAQVARFSLGGGIDGPLGDFNTSAKLGYHGLVGLSAMPREGSIGGRVDAVYTQFKDETPEDVNFQLIYGTANFVYNPRSAEMTGLHPYLIAGVGVYNFKQKGDDIPEDVSTSQTNLGANAGAGLDFTSGSTGLFVEGRFHNIFFKDRDDVQFIPITVGVRFGGH